MAQPDYVTNSFFKRVDDRNKITYDSYYEGIEANVLNCLGNEGWYVYRPEP